MGFGYDIFPNETKPSKTRYMAFDKYNGMVFGSLASKMSTQKNFDIKKGDNSSILGLNINTVNTKNLYPSSKNKVL